MDLNAGTAATTIGGIAFIVDVLYYGAIVFVLRSWLTSFLRRSRNRVKAGV